MSVSITFTNVEPPPRYPPATGWTQWILQESAASTGPWVTIDTRALTPDADPSNPAPRSFTTEAATLDDGWYRFQFKDAQNDETEWSDPQQNVDANSAWQPTVKDVANLLWARTRLPNGNYAGTFTAET